MKRSGRVGFWVIVSLVVTTGLGSVRADDESDRRSLIAKIDERLDRLPRQIGELGSASRDYVSDRASTIRSTLDELGSLVSDLSRVKGDDDRAKQIASDYPSILRDLKDATTALGQEKQRQVTAIDFTTKCKAFDAELSARAKDARDEPGSADTLSALAKSIGRQGEDLMNEAQRTRSDLERNRDDAKRFSPSGRWSAIRDALNQTADDLRSRWNDEHDRAKSACEEVVKRERHREIERALGRLGNSTAGRKQLVERITELLGTIAERIDGLDGQSSDSSARGAVQITSELDSLLSRLRDAQGDDRTARQIAETWPGWVRELRTSLEAVSDLKLNSGRADTGAAKCATAESELQAAIRGYFATEDDELRGRDQLPRQAEQIGREWSTKLDAAGQLDRDMERWSDAARRFDRSDAAWGRVRDKLRASTEQVFRHWRTSLEATRRACERLARGVDNPDVKRAIEEMTRNVGGAAQSYRTLRDEYRRWEEQVKQLYDWSAQDVEEIRRAYCAAPDAGEWDEVNAVADRWASQLNSLYGAITGQADRMKRLADELINKKRALKAAPKVKEAVDKVLESIAKIKDYQLRGSNNPLVKARADFGMAEHERRQNSCDAKEITITGCDNPNKKRRDCRIDCVRGCTIIEIKPEGREAEELGRKQLRAYVNALQDMYASRGAGMFGDSSFARFRACVTDDKKALNLSSDVDTYRFCPQATDLAGTVQPVRIAIPDEGQ